MVGSTKWPPGRYYTVILVQDEEGHAVADLLQDQGAQAATINGPFAGAIHAVDEQSSALGGVI